MLSRSRVSPLARIFRYSGANTRTLVVATQYVTGVRWQDFFNKRVWSKIGAKNPFLAGLVSDASPAAAGLPWIRGGLVEHGSAAGPLTEARSYGAGSHHAAAMRDSALRRRLWVFTMQGEDLPQATNRVDLDPTVRDAWGRPAGRVTYQPHRHELAASEHYGAILEAVMSSAGAEWAFSTTSPPVTLDLDAARRHGLGMAPASYHVMGTARMGADPRTSVFDPNGRSWDLDNVLCADSSVFPTASGYNPTLTICALAHRAASLLVDDPLPPTEPRP